MASSGHLNKIGDHVPAKKRCNDDIIDYLESLEVEHTANRMENTLINVGTPASFALLQGITGLRN